MPKAYRCLVLYGLQKPGALWRWYRRLFFSMLNRRIEALPVKVQSLENSYRPSSQTMVISAQEIDGDCPCERRAI